MKGVWGLWVLAVSWVFSVGVLAVSLVCVRPNLTEAANSIWVHPVAIWGRTQLVSWEVYIGPPN